VKNKGLIFVISGPSGSGKTTLLKELLAAADLKGRLSRSISLTTRPRRSGERNGGDYFFISREHFQELLRQNKILEWTKYLGYYYGTPGDRLKQQIKKGRNIALCLDAKGARTIKKLYPRNTVAIFVLPPSYKALGERIKRRCHKTGIDEIRKRLNLGQKELRFVKQYDYSLVNKDLGRALKKLKGIVLRLLKKS